MKKIVSLILALTLVFALALPTMAAGITADESALLAKFKSAVDSYASKINDSAVVAQYKAEAESALTKVDLDKAACDDLSKAIDEALAFLSSKNPKNRADIKALLPELLGIVNKAANKYGMSVSVDDVVAKEGFAHVSIQGTPINGGSGIVKQTGFDTTVTFVVLGALAVALAFGMVVVRKEKLVSRG